nr:multifunctional CCA addition/repair protein [Comamonas thiooxydans]
MFTFTPPAGLNAYLVGGAARDLIMGRQPVDHDFVVVGATPSQLTGLGFKQVGADFPVYLHPDTKDEYAMARTERKTGAGYHGFAVDASTHVTLEQDLGRRDLTINAIAMSPEGSVIDPFGGVLDIQKRVLRHVDAAAFVEDPVRVLRLARFAARYSDFSVAPETVQLAKSMVDSGELNALVPERVWAELSKGLMESMPSRMLRFLQECGALAVILPEVDNLHQVPQKAAHHPEICTLRHVFLCVDYAAAAGYDLDVRFAVLVHDLGKGLTPKDQLPAHISHDSAGVPLVTAVATRLKTPKATRELAELVCAEHIVVHGAHAHRSATLVKLLQRLGAFNRPGRLTQVMQACISDARGRLGLGDKPYPQFELMHGVLEAAKSVDLAEVSARNRNPADLPMQIHAARTEAVEAFRKQQQDSVTNVT